MKKNIFIIFSFLLFFTNYLLYSTKITISAIGDIMAHIELQQYAFLQNNIYLHLFEPTNKIFLKDDLTIGNLETPICDDLPISGFPQFNAKSSLLDAIKSSGIEVLSIANNHTLDHGMNAIKTTVNEIKKRELIYAGAGHSKEDAIKPFIFQVKGIVIAFFSATWVTNIGQKISSYNDPYVYIVPMNNIDVLNDFCDRIKKTKNKVDLVIVSYHAAVEYTSIPVAEKEKTLKLFAESGADIILGHHPHVLQKVEYYYTKDSRKTIIAFSLGNFISSQARYTPVINKGNNWIYDSVLTKTAESIILQFDIIKWKKNISIVNARAIPIFNICFPYYKNKIKYIGYKTLFMEDILKVNKNNFLGYNDFDNSIKKLVNYRYSRIKKLIKIPIISPNQ